METFKARGVSAWGGPVYAKDDLDDFLMRWLRMSWAQALCGREFDATGETVGFYLTRVLGIDAIRSTRSGISRKPTLAGELDIRCEIHMCFEDSALVPAQVFQVSERATTILFRADLEIVDGTFVLKQFAVDPMTREMQQVRDRYGGRREWYVWDGTTYF